MTATLKQWLEANDFKITEGREYSWKIYGHHAYALSRWNGAFSSIYDGDAPSSEVIFDTRTQVVYEMTVHDYARKLSYRWFAPGFAEKHRREAERLDLDHREAYDDVRFVDLESLEDLLVKMKAIMNGQSYDERVTIELDLEDDLLFEMMKLAHEKDVTLNQMIESVISEAVSMQSLWQEFKIDDVDGQNDNYSW